MTMARVEERLVDAQREWRERTRSVICAREVEDGTRLDVGEFICLTGADFGGHSVVVNKSRQKMKARRKKAQRTT